MGLLSCALLERGFLVEVKDGLIYLTNNAYLRKNHFDADSESSDLTVLWELLGIAIPEYRYIAQEDWYGHRQDERRHLHTLIGTDCNITPEAYDRLFAREHFRMESGHYLPYCGRESVALFKRRDTTRKIPILVLDAHAALLTKSLSAVGCRTISACAGDAEVGKARPLEIILYDSHNVAWARHLLKCARAAGLSLPDLRVIGHSLRETQSSLNDSSRDLQAVRRQAISLGRYLYQQREELRWQRQRWANGLSAQA